MACFTKLFPCCCPWSECCELPPPEAPPRKKSLLPTEPTEQAATALKINKISITIPEAPKPELPNQVKNDDDSPPPEKGKKRSIVRVATIQERGPTTMTALTLSGEEAPANPEKPQRVFSMAAQGSLNLHRRSPVFSTIYSKPQATVVLALNTESPSHRSSLDNKSDGTVVDG